MISAVRSSVTDILLENRMLREHSGLSVNEIADVALAIGTGATGFAIVESLVNMPHTDTAGCATPRTAAAVLRVPCRS